MADKKFVILTDDGPFNRDVYLSWTNEAGGYYTTVDSIDDICKYDVYDTVKQAEDRARDADSGTFGGWQAPMTVCQVINYEAVINDDEEPDLLPIETITFHN